MPFQAWVSACILPPPLHSCLWRPQVTALQYKGDLESSLSAEMSVGPCGYGCRLGQGCPAAGNTQGSPGGPPQAAGASSRKGWSSPSHQWSRCPATAGLSGSKASMTRAWLRPGCLKAAGLWKTFFTMDRKRTISSSPTCPSQNSAINWVSVTPLPPNDCLEQRVLGTT